MTIGLNRTKACTKCGEVKAFSEYTKRGDGYKGVCRQCVNKRTRELRMINRESFLEKRRIYAEKNKEKMRDYGKRYREENKERLAVSNKLWRAENKEKLAKDKKDYHTKRYSTDPLYRAKHNLRRRMGAALNGQNKSASTMDLIGCSPERLREHIESQFTEGMTWDNYGLYGWHIDHIIPCSSFDMLDPNEQKKCFHYTNLQPLWAEENLTKSNKWVDQLK